MQLRHQRCTNRTFFYLPASFFCSSTLVSYESTFFRRYFKTPSSVSLMHMQTTRMLFFTGNLCERHEWRAPAALWLPLVYSLSRVSVPYVGVQPCMPHLQSTMVFTNNRLLKTEEPTVTITLNTASQQATKSKINLNAIHMPMPW